MSFGIGGVRSDLENRTLMQTNKELTSVRQVVRKHASIETDAKNVIIQASSQAQSSVQSSIGASAEGGWLERQQKTREINEWLSEVKALRIELNQAFKGVEAQDVGKELIDALSRLESRVNAD